MIGLVPDDLKASVNLLKEHHPHHLMRKGHFGEREFEVRPPADLLRKSKTSTDDEGHIALSFKAKTLNLRCQFF